MAVRTLAERAPGRARGRGAARADRRPTPCSTRSRARRSSGSRRPSNPGLDVADMPRGRRARARGGRARGGRQHARHAARPAPARARRRLLDVERLEVHQPATATSSSATSPSRDAGARRAAASTGATDDRLDPRAVRGLARAPLARHARRAARARSARTRSRSPSSSPARDDVTRRPLPGPARRPGPRARRAADDALRHGRRRSSSAASERAERVPRRRASCRRGDELRRRPHERRAPRPLGPATRCREGFIRLSAGCEDAADLIADIEQALDASRARLTRRAASPANSLARRRAARIGSRHA